MQGSAVRTGDNWISVGASAAKTMKTRGYIQQLCKKGVDVFALA